MSVVDRLKRPTSDQEEYLYLNSQSLGEDLDYIKTNRIENLMLIPNSDGFHLDNIDFLQEIPFVKRLQRKNSCRLIPVAKSISFGFFLLKANKRLRPTLEFNFNRGRQWDR